MEKIWGFLKKNRVNKPLEAMQIEISSICNLKCRFCPTTYLNSKLERGLMSFEVFERLRPYFPWAKWVYLQGWGEPLLHPDLWKMVEIIKETGSKVGFTTNGTRLNHENIKKVLNYHLDLISTSIAGATALTHERLRVNSNFQEIINSIEALVVSKKKAQRKFPVISMSYMLTKESIAELPLAVKLAWELGIDDFYTTNLDYVFNEEVNNNKVFTWQEEPNSEYEDFIRAAQEFANAKNFAFRYYPLFPQEERAVCDLNPSKFVFITSNGDVTPCTYLGRIKNPRYFKDTRIDLPRKVFGNINTEEFNQIWSKEKYQEFRANFEIRANAYQNLISSYTDYEPSLTRIKEADKKCAEIFQSHPFPEECRTCPKVFGI